MSSREVVLDGGSPWGFRMHGGVDVHQPLRISRVNPGSKASQKGIREGDFISSINGQSTKNITNADAHALLKNSGQTLRLGLNEDITGSPKRKLGKNSQDGDSLKRSSITSISSTSTINRVLSSIHNTNNETNTSNNTNEFQQRKGDHQFVSPPLSTSDRQNGLNGSLIADNNYHQRHSRTSVSASNSFTVGTPVEPRGGDKTNVKGVSVRSIVMADSNNGGRQSSSTDGSGEPAGGRRSARNRRRAHHRSRKSSSKNVVTVAESIAETNEHEENLSTTIDISTNRNVVIDNNEISLCTTGGETVSDKILVDTVETMQEQSASKVTDVELVNKQTVNIDSAVNKSAEKSFVEQCSEISTRVSSQEIVVESVKSNSSNFDPEKKSSKSRRKSSKNNTNKTSVVEDINKNTENVCNDYFKETKAQVGSEESMTESDRQKETENIPNIKDENTKECEIDVCMKLKTNTQHLSNICNENDFIEKRKSTVSCDSVDEEVEKITSAMEYGQSHYSVYMEQCSLFTRINTEPETNIIQSLGIEESKIASEQEDENKRENVEDNNLSDSKIQNLVENYHEMYKENTTKQLEKTNTTQVTTVEDAACNIPNNSIQSKEDESTKQEESASKNESKNCASELELNFEFDSNEKVSTEMKIATVTENTCRNDVEKSVIHESVNGGRNEQKESEDFQVQKTDDIKAPSTANENLVSKEPENEDIKKGISSDSLGSDLADCTEIKNEQITKETTASMTSHHNILELTTVTNIESDSEVIVCEQNYRVESPPPIINKNSKSPKTAVPKSRSLDDDENKLEITEIVESTEEHDEENDLSKHLVENSAIISEADDVKWEEAGVLRIAEKAKPSLSIIGLSLEDDFKRTESFETKGAMSPEDEKNLREFLEGLKLATSPLEATRQLSEKTSKELLTPENLSVRKAKKRAELELFFQPAFMNPRYLNVIQEEGVEMSSSGRDSKTVSESRSWTDDWDIDDDVFINEDNLKSLKNEPMVFNQKQVKIVNAKMIEIQGEYSKECMWTTHKMEPSSGAEIVYLEDSSCSRTPSDIPEQENASDAEDEASCEDRLCWEKDDDIYENVEYKDGHPLFQNDDKADAITESCDRISDDLNNKTENDTDKKQNNIAPPPTPELYNIGKNEISEEPLSEDIKSFIKKLLEVLSQTDNSEKVYELLKETPLEKFPDEMKETVRDLLNAHNLDISDKCKTLESSEETISSEIIVGVEVSNNELTEVLKVTNKNIDEPTFELSKNVETPNVELTENIKSTNNSELKDVHINESAILEKFNEEIQSIDTVEKLKTDIMGTLNNENLQNDIDEEFEKLYSNLKCQEKSSPVNSRPDSSASVCSSTSQSTAKFIPSCASLADIAALLHDEPVYENVFSKRSVSKERSIHRQIKVNSLKEATPKSKSETPVYEDIQTSPKSLRELCVQNILSLPYGADILEELAIVSETIENLTADVPAVEESINKTEETLKCKSDENVYDTVTKCDHNSIHNSIQTKKIDSSKYDSVHYSTSDETDYQQYVVFNSCKISPASNISHQQHEHYFSQYDSDTTVANNCPIDSSPMSMSMRTSPDGWVGIPTQDDPNVLVCLSPSQKIYIDQRQCIDKKEADQLLDMHKKFLERRCYHEEQFVLPMKNILKDKVTLSRYVDTPGWISENVLKTQSMAMKNAASMPDKNTTLKNVAASSSEKVCFPRGEEGRDKAVCDEKECTSSSNRLLAIIRDTSSDDCRKMCTSTEMQQRDFIQRGNTARIVREPDNGNKVLNYNEHIRKLMTNNNSNDDTDKCLTYDDTIRELQKISKTDKNNESTETSVLSINNTRKNLTIPRDLNKDYKIIDDREKSEDRLKARQLSEWMQLARNRSSVPANFEFKIDGNNSSSVKSVAFDAKRVLTCSGAVKVDDTVQRLFTGDRKRFSLPQDMHERQLQYILEQEREIEREIRELEKEKISSMPDDIRRPVTTGQSKQSSDSSLFQRENKNVYHISKRGDIATIQSDFNLPFAKSKNRTEESNARPKSMSSLQTPIAHGERFRQQMYDEYMHKVAEREERKQHKVIKISSSKPVSSNAASDLHAEIFKQHALKIESEFMNRVKERMDKLGLNFSDDEGEAAKQTDSQNESEPVLVIDGSSLKEGKDLPKHLQEFVNFTSSTEITSSQNESVNCSESKSVKLLSSNKTEINRVLVNTPNESNSFTSPVAPSKTDDRPKEDEEEEVSKVLVHSITPSNVDDRSVKEKLKKIEEATGTSSVVRHLLEMAKASSRDDEERRFRARRTASDELRRVERRNASLLHEIDSSLTLGKGFLLARGIWSPSHKKSSSISEATAEKSTSQEVPSSGLPPATFSGGDKESKGKEESPPPPIWTPRSAEPSPQAERKEFRPVRFESPVLGRKHKASSEETKTPDSRDSPAQSAPPPWQPTPITSHQQSSAAITVSQSLERRLPTSHSAPAGGTLSSLAATSRLPRAQNPTITLLQKAREGQLPRGASYLEEARKTARRGNDRPPLLNPHEVVYSVKNEYTSESESEGPKRMVDLGPRKFEGIGPTTKDGMPIVLRSEVKDSNQAKWYKRMYETLHKAKDDSEYVTVRYKQRRAGRYPYTSGSGYLSEPEPNAFGGYDSDTTRQYATLDRRRPVSSSMSPAPVGKENSYVSSTMPRNNKHMSASAVKYATDIYKNQPGRIENYMPGHSSISEKETKEWWDEVMEIFDGQWLDDNSPLPRQYSNLLAEAITRSHLEQQKHVTTNRQYMAHALKESGYESDSTLIFRRRDDTSQQLSPQEQKEAYKTIQRGGEVPLHGLRKPAPERPKDESEIEYFPISPTLTRIRIHKHPTPINQILCYPITKVPSPPPSVFSRQQYPHINRPSRAPSIYATQPSSSSRKVPSPPRRRSSRNNATLKLISTMTITSPTSSRVRKTSSHRHDACYEPSTKKDSSTSNVQFLKDRISCKLSSSPIPRKKTSPDSSSKRRVKVTKTISTSTPSISSSGRLKLTSTISTVKDGNSTDKVKSRTNVSTGESISMKRSVPQQTSRISSPRYPSEPPGGTASRNLATKIRAASLERTFGVAKRKVDLSIPSRDYRLVQTPDLISPTEVQKIVQKHKESSRNTILPSGATVKKSTSLCSSVRNGARLSPKTKERTLDVAVSTANRGRELLRNSDLKMKGSKLSPISQKRRVPSPVLVNTMLRYPIVSLPKKSDLDETKKKKTTTAIVIAKPLQKITNIEPKNDNKVNYEKGTKRKKTKKGNGDNGKNEECKKSRKNGKNKEIKNKEKENKLIAKCVGRTAGTEIVKKLKKMERPEESSFRGYGDITVDELNQQKEAIKTGSFYQNLLLRNVPSPTLSTTSGRSTMVLEKAKRFQSFQHKSPSDSLNKIPNVYLSYIKPVSESKFRSLDLQNYYSSSVRSYSPASHRVADKIEHFDSISQIDEKEDDFTFDRFIRDQSPDIYGGRSSSEPPMKLSDNESKEYVVNRHYYDNVSPRGGVSPSPVRSPSRRKIISARMSATKPVETIEGPKPVKVIRARSAGDADAVKREIRRSLLSPTPSFHSTSSLNLSQISDRSEYQAYVTELIRSSRKSEKYKNLKGFYLSLERLGQLAKTTSSTDLRPRRKDEEIIDYDRWKKVRTLERAEAEMKMLFGRLKADEKEKGFVFQPSDVNTVRWRKEKDRGLRIKEKSVEDLKGQFNKIKDEGSDLDLTKRRELEAKKDVYKPLWRGNSVVDLAHNMVEKRSVSEGRAQSFHNRPSFSRRQNFGFGSRLWSSLSMEQVNALKNQLAEIYSQTGFRKPKTIKEGYVIDVPSEKKRQLPEENKLHVRSTSLISQNDIEKSKQIHNHREPLPKGGSLKADSISSFSRAEPSTSASLPGTLSESEKKRLSQTLSQEILIRTSQRRARATLPIMLPKETMGAVAAANANIAQTKVEIPSPRTCYSLEMSEDGTVPTTKYGNKSSKSDFVLVLTPSDKSADRANVKEVLDGWAQPKVTAAQRPSSISETESASSETSTKTVIYRGNKETDVRQKVEFFENQKDTQPTEVVIYKPADDDIIFKLDEELAVKRKEILGEKAIIPVKDASYHSQSLDRSGKLVPSQSYADLKELFGEQEFMKFATVPISKSTGLSPVLLRKTLSSSPVRISSAGSSLETLHRSHSVSPDPEKYWRAYLALVKHGDVLRLKRRFESLENINRRSNLATSKRYKSDPELTRNLLAREGTDIDRTTVRGSEYGDVDWLRKKYEASSRSSRGRSRIRRSVRPVSPIPKIPLRLEDRFMPHINIISKLAALKNKRPSASAPSRERQQSVKELAAKLGCPAGEVEKLRQKFDSPERKMSILGHMFTSSPNVHELRDIAPYLAGPWVAHQYPRRQDNIRSLSTPETARYINGTYPPRREHKPRPKSSSPPRPKKPPPSILKSQIRQSDIFANQHFDPSIHRPISRYLPSSPKTDTKSPRSVPHKICWLPSSAVYSYGSRPTVTFKEPELAPIPPPKGRHIIRDFGPESPRRYVENEVTIHYRSPVRQEVKEILSEEELARRQAEAMRRIYQEERRRKYLQELQDMNSRRHTDNFTPSQKSPIPLNRYDDFDEVSMTKQLIRSRDRTPEPRLVARALFNFVGQSSRELTFKKGDIIYVRRQIDKNWYEGEHNAMIGLFPVNYVEIIPYDGFKTVTKKPHEGQARAKFNFIAQTHLELSLAKGETVVLTRRVDDNWFEGRIGNKKGIFPVSYVEVAQYPGEQSEAAKPVASPAAHSMLLNGSSGGKQSMGSHHYQPSFSPSAGSAPGTGTNSLTGSYHHAKPVNVMPVGSTSSLTRPTTPKQPPVDQTLHVDTQSEPIPYRAMYKYRPQNEDELELQEGDTVYVLEKCDDGWYVGSSQRTGAFGTFPGNYVERI